MPKRKPLQDEEMCGWCGGRCCQAFPGFLLPEDVGEVTRDALETLFSTGNYSVDREWGVKIKGKKLRGYFVRARRIDPVTKFPAGWIDFAKYGGECIFWIYGKGCSKTFEERPWECRTLVPDVGKCNKHSPPIRGDSRRFAARRWASYEHLIEELIQTHETYNK